MKKILITNDDGIDSEGLLRITQLAVRYGDVWVVAPDGQRSASSHSITLHDSLKVFPYDYPVEGVVEAWSCNGTPADCVRVGSITLMPERPDIVISGINKGYNCATDLQYSGTVGAAFEAAFQGYHSIALSEGFRGVHEVTDWYLPKMLPKLLDEKLEYGEIWNVNFPECPLDDCKGVLENRTVSHSMFYRDTYDIVEELPDGGKRLMVHGHNEPKPEAGTDLEALMNNYVSVGVAKNMC